MADRVNWNYDDRGRMTTVADLKPGDTYTRQYRPNGRGPLLVSEPKTVDRVSIRGRGVLRVWDTEGNVYEAPGTSIVELVEAEATESD